MKEDVVAANLANLRQSINELKECIEKQNATVPISVFTTDYYSIFYR